jgi:hypothetical protein
MTQHGKILEYFIISENKWISTKAVLRVNFVLRTIRDFSNAGATVRFGLGKCGDCGIHSGFSAESDAMIWELKL